jgi:hypothetical protein
MDASFWDEIERSRSLTGGQRMRENMRLFDEASRRMLAGIKSEFPDISDEEARRIRNERLELIRRIESLSC